jgi:hypothetical protein
LFDIYKSGEAADGPVGLYAASGVVAAAAAAYAASKGYNAMSSLIPQSAGGVRDFGLFIGSVAAAAPAVTGFISSMTRDGLIRGAIEGAAFITMPFFAGQLLASAIEIGPGWGNALALVMGLGGAVAYGAGQVNRFQANGKK